MVVLGLDFPCCFPVDESHFPEASLLNHWAFNSDLFEHSLEPRIDFLSTELTELVSELRHMGSFCSFKQIGHEGETNFDSSHSDVF
jgi:hypothetical protein